MGVKIIRITTVPSSLKILLKGQLRFMSQHGFDVVAVSSGGALLKGVAEAEGVRIVAIEMTRTISPFIDMKSLIAFYKLCRSEKPVIVHSHSPKAGIVAMLGATLAGVPIRLHTVAGLPLMESKGVKRILLNFVERLTYRCATKVYPNSFGLSDFIIRNDFTRMNKLKVLGNGSSNGVDTTFFDPSHFSPDEIVFYRKSLGITRSDFVFIYVGRLVGDKGINELIDAFSLLMKRVEEHQQVKLLLVGSLEPDLDPVKAETLKIIEENGSVLSLGFKEDVRPYFAISDCLVFPSYREGFPNVVMQAGAMGIPSIVTDINGCNEIIREGKNGVIIPAKDVNALLLAMTKMYFDREFYRKLQIKSRSVICDDYEQTVIWQILLEEYRALLKEK
jgi:glycosyltransferase involved in cell wall biosynthesis